MIVGLVNGAFVTESILKSVVMRVPESGVIVLTRLTYKYIGKYRIW